MPIRADTRRPDPESHVEEASHELMRDQLVSGIDISVVTILE